MIFNKTQEEVINNGVQFLKYSSNQVFEYDGEAGTGKSVVLFEILRRAGYTNKEILPMAYTGQAAIVMRTKGFHNAKTIHSGIYTIENSLKYDNDNVLMNTYFNTPETEDVFVVKDQLDKEKKVIVIDEGYLVPIEMKKHIEKFGLKIIVTGDSGQLPPINSQPAYLVNPQYHLTELMRQNETDGIVYIARRARRGLPIHCGSYGNALVIEEDCLSDKMIMDSNIIICGTNKKREYLNDYIRGNLLDIHNTLPVYGDRLICRKNNWNIEIDGISLANGLVGTAVSPPNVNSFDGKVFMIDFMPDLLNRSFPNLLCDYKYLVSKSVEERNRIKSSKYSVGEKFEYAYASTTHLAQGAEYNGGVYIEEYLGNDIQNNLNYSGITRFKNWIIYVKKKRKYF